MLRLPWARARYAQRKTEVEPPLAEIKQAMGFRRAQLRGLATVAGEWKLVSAARNLRRLCALRGAPARARTRAAGFSDSWSRVPSLSRWLCQPRHADRAERERSALALFPEPGRSLGSAS